MTALLERYAPLERESFAIHVAGAELLCDPTGLLVWPQEDLLVVADLHLEKGASFARRGSLLPPYDTGMTLRALARGIARHAPRRVVCLGDSFHDRRAAEHMPEPWRAMLWDMMAGRQWLWISGNHDPIAPAGLGGESATELALGPLVLRHEPSPGRTQGEIAGHLHPLARIARRGGAIRRPCFACDGSRLIMPAFGALTGGLNLLDPAFGGLFDLPALRAHVLGRNRIYTIASSQIR